MLLPAQRGDDKARIGSIAGLLGLGDHSTGTRPALARAVGELLEAPRRPLCSVRLGSGRVQLSANRAHQARVLRQPKHVVHAVLLAPAHQRLATKPRVGAQEDRNVRPARTDLRNDPLDFLLRTGSGREVRGPQLRAWQMLPAEASTEKAAQLTAW